jgi:hemolysin III
VRRPAARHALRALDQAVIFLFIAGSYTPVALTWLRDGSGWWAMHAAVWGVAAAGFVAKIAFAYRVRPESVSATLYLLVSWLPVLATYPVMSVLPGRLMLWMLAGGVCYTAGVLFFHYDRRVPYFHAAWHVLVIAGSACHYAGIFFYCTAPVG